MNPEHGGARRERAGRRALLRALAFAVGVTAAAGAGAQRDRRFLEDEVEPPREPLPESPVRLPPYPRRGDLVALDGALFEGGARVFLDPASLSQPRPAVVRYTMLLVSAGGVENLLYESVHCGNDEWRTLAFGTAAEEFQLVARPRWRSLRAGGSTAVRRTIARAYVCVLQRRVPDRAEDLRRRLQRAPAAGGGPRPRPER